VILQLRTYPFSCFLLDLELEIWSRFPLTLTLPLLTSTEYEDVPVAAIESGEWPLLKWDCAPGDVIVFHGKTLHGASGNASSTRHRRVLSLRWVGDDAVVAERPWDVSPPLMAELSAGQHLWQAPDIFPIVYTNSS
jgi:hypothetical protein